MTPAQTRALLERAADALRAIAESYPRTEEGETLAGIAREALREVHAALLPWQYVVLYDPGSRGSYIIARRLDGVRGAEAYGGKLRGWQSYPSPVEIPKRYTRRGDAQRVIELLKANGGKAK